MAMPMKNEQDTQNKKGKTEKRGFYAALAICLAAIGIAAWSTYDTMSDALKPVTDLESSAVSAAAATPTPEDDPESLVSSGHGQGAAPEVELENESEVETEPAGSTAAPIEESVAQETAAEPAEEYIPAEATAVEPVTYAVSEHYLRPLKSEKVLMPYSDIPVYSETMRDYRVHLGTDYEAERGETVKALGNGIVKEAYTDMLLGNILVIEHGGVEVRYCGLGETFLVEPGEIVSAGQDIGSVTAAPFESAMETHLHIEAIKNGQQIDPETLFN